MHPIASIPQYLNAPTPLELDVITIDDDFPERPIYDFLSPHPLSSPLRSYTEVLSFYVLIVLKIKEAKRSFFLHSHPGVSI